jgi:hypothetical protein
MNPLRAGWACVMTNRCQQASGLGPRCSWSGRHEVKTPSAARRSWVDPRLRIRPRFAALFSVSCIVRGQRALDRRDLLLHCRHTLPLVTSVMESPVRCSRSDKRTDWSRCPVVAAVQIGLLLQLPDGHVAPAFFRDDLVAQVEAFEADRNLAEPTDL